jgi:hypothetical protein
VYPKVAEVVEVTELTRAHASSRELTRGHSARSDDEGLTNFSFTHELPRVSHTSLFS